MGWWGRRKGLLWRINCFALSSTVLNSCHASLFSLDEIFDDLWGCVIITRSWLCPSIRVLSLSRAFSLFRKQYFDLRCILRRAVPFRNIETWKLWGVTISFFAFHSQSSIYSILLIPTMAHLTSSLHHPTSLSNLSTVFSSHLCLSLETSSIAPAFDTTSPMIRSLLRSAFLFLLVLSSFSILPCLATNVPHAHRMGMPCASTCRVFLCENLKDPIVRPNGASMMLRNAYSPFSGFFCQSRRPLFNVTTGEAQVSVIRSGEAFVGISKYRPSSIDTRFPRNFLSAVNTTRGLFRLQRASLTAKQFRESNRLCVRLPITSYMPLGKNGLPQKPVAVTPQDCISMRLYTSKIRVSLTWNSSFDFDLFLREPNGNTISRLRDSTLTGGEFARDKQPNCERRTPPEMVEEKVIYPLDSEPLVGMYRIRAKLFRTCDNSLEDTLLTFRALVYGRTVFKERVVIKNDITAPTKFDMFFRIRASMLKL